MEGSVTVLPEGEKNSCKIRMTTRGQYCLGKNTDNQFKRNLFSFSVLVLQKGIIQTNTFHTFMKIDV